MQDISFLNNVNIDGDEIVRGNERVEGHLRVTQNVELSGSILSGGIEISTLWGAGAPVDALVTSVNGLTGDVVLNAASVAALSLTGGTVTGVTNINAPLNAVSALNAAVLNVANTGNFLGAVNIYGDTSIAGSVYTDSFIIATPGDDLALRYAQAKTLTPGGSAISDTNRSTLVLLPGNYSLSATLDIDGEFVDVVGLGYTTKQPKVFVSNNTLSAVANNVKISGISVGTQAFYAADNKSLQVFESCVGGSGSFCSGVGSVAAGTFLDCVAGSYSFGGEGTASGKFVNCEGTNNCFGGIGTASGVFENCTAGDYSFGSQTVASGVFKNCTGGTSSFAGNGGVASGTFIDCVGTDYSFADFGVASGIFTRCKINGEGGFGATSSGTFTECVGNTYSFGSFGDASGVYVECTSNGDYSFGSYGTASGTFRRCIATGVANFGGGGIASGIFFDCVGGIAAFGGGHVSNNGYCRGKFVNCEGGVNSYGDLPGSELSGKLYSCRLRVGAYTTVFSQPVTAIADGVNYTVFVTETNHGYTTDMGVVLSTSGALPDGILPDKNYYISSDSLTLTSFLLKEYQSEGGISPILIGGASQSGNHTVTSARLVNCVDGYDEIVNV